MILFQMPETLIYIYIYIPAGIDRIQISQGLVGGEGMFKAIYCGYSKHKSFRMKIVGISTPLTEALSPRILQDVKQTAIGRSDFSL